MAEYLLGLSRAARIVESYGGSANRGEEIRVIGQIKTSFSQRQYPLKLPRDSDDPGT
ncbi:hypothetical protein PanWU01x14_170560 [Parasponia andersonii]|uniref:Uncharacterized protein n=1 Tax=Parasponia andersonii TaxID=3476 RepID=A0A2P5CA70_PARAD|nr:hypothetical protein PanWU01x14_170560 [Parasponia andersonii]